MDRDDQGYEMPLTEPMSRSHRFFFAFGVISFAVCGLIFSGAFQ